MISNNQAMVSIIVPVFNTQKYIKKCLLSIMNQTYRNLEIIIIDDGSTDSSGKICDEFGRKDSRVHVLHASKEGVSKARNLGIKQAKGRYIQFVDSDDWLSTDAIEKMVTKLEKEEADFCYANYVRIETFNNKPEILSSEITSCERINNSSFVNVLDQMGLGPCWKLFRHDIIKENHLCFPSGQQWGEDTIFVLQYLNCCNKLTIEKDVVYFYNRLNVFSTTKTFHTEINQWFFHMVQSYKELFQDSLDELVVQEFLFRKCTGFCNYACNHYALFEKQFGEKTTNEKIRETICLFEQYLTRYYASCTYEKEKKFQPLKEYLESGNLIKYKRNFTETNYEMNLANWKKQVFEIKRKIKIFYYYEIKLHKYDFDFKRKTE